MCAQLVHRGGVRVCACACVCVKRASVCVQPEGGERFGRPRRVQAAFVLSSSPLRRPRLRSLNPGGSPGTGWHSLPPYLSLSHDGGRLPPRLRPPGLRPDRRLLLRCRRRPHHDGGRGAAGLGGGRAGAPVCACGRLGGVPGHPGRARGRAGGPAAGECVHAQLLFFDLPDQRPPPLSLMSAVLADAAALFSIPRPAPSLC